MLEASGVAAVHCLAPDAYKWGSSCSSRAFLNRQSYLLLSFNDIQVKPFLTLVKDFIKTVLQVINLCFITVMASSIYLVSASITTRQMTELHLLSEYLFVTSALLALSLNSLHMPKDSRMSLSARKIGRYHVVCAHPATNSAMLLDLTSSTIWRPQFHKEFRTQT